MLIIEREKMSVQYDFLKKKLYNNILLNIGVNMTIRALQQDLEF